MKYREPKTKETDYGALLDSAAALIGGVPHKVANLANLSALIYGALDRLNWAGFYLSEGDRLVLGPFQGKPACIEIPLGKGVCGTAAASGKTLLVPDVHLFQGHIACDADSNSELVVPIKKDGRVAGVIDLDSPERGRFTEEDARGLERLAELISGIF